MRGVLAMAVVALLALPGLALAQGPPGGPGGGGPPGPPRSGQLEASGSGSALLSGRLVAFGEITGVATQGRIQVRDRAGDATFTFDGAPVRFNRRGRAQVRGSTGRFFVSGTAVRITLARVKLSLSSAGRGLARLRGQGLYRLNSERTRRWNGRAIRIAPSPPGNRRRPRDDGTVRDRSTATGGAARRRAA